MRIPRNDLTILGRLPLVALCVLVFVAQAVFAEPPVLHRGAVPARVLDLAPDVRSERGMVGGLECNVTDFEGYGNLQPIGTIEGGVDVTFGDSWLALIDEDAGGTGNFANEPSPDTTAFFLDPAEPIDFGSGVQFVEIFYSAASVALPATLTAWSGPGGTGSVVDTAVGNTLGTGSEGAACQGDPTGEFCLWSTITLVSSTDNIRSITLSGATENFIGFDNMTFCTAPPLELIVGQEVQVRPANVGPREPDVIYNKNGGKVVIWEEERPGGTVICIQFFDEDDLPTTTPIVINKTGGFNSTPTASFLPNNTLFVSWRNSAVDPGSQVVTSRAPGGSALFGGFFNPSGAPVTPDLGEMTVSQGAGSDSNDPEATGDGKGNTLVTWEDDGLVLGRRYGPDGKPLGSAFPVSDTGSGAGRRPKTASSPSGDFVTTWRQTSGSKTGLLVRVFNDKGQPKGPSRIVDGVLNARAPTVAMDRQGDFVVAYEKNGPSGRDIFARLYSKTGQPKAASYLVNSNVDGDQTLPNISMNAQGEFFIVWKSTTQATGRSFRGTGGTVPVILGRFFTPAGDAPRTESTVAETQNGSAPTNPDVSLDDDDDVTVVYEREGPDESSEGIFRTEIETGQAPSVCVPDGQTLCLNDGRFRVTVNWETPSDSGVGQAVELTPDTGYFWFFRDTNVEAIIKVLDACSGFDRFWVFAAGLTNQEVDIRVDDVVTGVSKTYFNPSVQFQPINDTLAFDTCDAGQGSRSPEVTEAFGLDVPADPLAATILADRTMDELVALNAEINGALEATERGNCVTNNKTLCLNGGRFAVETSWRTPQGEQGTGQAEQLTNDTGYFWFFRPGNIEMIVKVLNACSGFNRYWVFAGGLTNVEVEMVVTDTQTNTVNVYKNPIKTPFVPIQDTNAFPTCP